MKIRKLKHFTGGWLVGNFSPALIRTKKFEFAVKQYRAGFIDPAHYHKKADEVTAIISGVFTINGKKVRSGDVFVIRKNTTAAFACVKGGYTAVVKTTSAKGDKYLTRTRT